MNLTLIVIMSMLAACTTFCQTDSLKAPQSDSSKAHSVKRAMLYSAMAPGAGQIYNHIAMPKGQKKAFWKVPLIYAGLGTMSYFLFSNNSAQRSLKLEYLNRQNGEPTDPQWEAYDDDGILTLYNQYLGNRDLSILGLAAVYAFQIADAGIEAHFVRFDISKDLSIAFRPVILLNGNPGLNATFDFH
ncbi:MAG: DUF5683 domain-containing protein [Bacteroidota bacterium]|jgi:hypothetical protein